MGFEKNDENPFELNKHTINEMSKIEKYEKLIRKYSKNVLREYNKSVSNEKVLILIKQAKVCGRPKHAERMEEIFIRIKNSDAEITDFKSLEAMCGLYEHIELSKEQTVSALEYENKIESDNLELDKTDKSNIGGDKSV